MIDEEDVTAQLLKLAGAPPEPARERSARAREAVHQAWRAHRRRRFLRRGLAATVLGGVAASLVIAAVMNRPRITGVRPANEPVVAIGARVQGRPLVRSQEGAGGDVPPMVVSTPVYAGDVVETDGASRASLQTTDGSSIRIDRGSRVRFAAPTAIELITGAAYIETSPGTTRFEVRTPMGVVRDVGTQFEVRLTDSSLRLRVRTGTVQLQRGAEVTATTAGTETMVTTTGLVARPVPTFGAEWAWTAELAPPFAIEGRSLRAFLEHIAGEQGWTLQYASPEVAEAAGRTILHGSVDGLSAEEALDVALATSGLEYHLSDGELLVSQPGDAR